MIYWTEIEIAYLYFYLYRGITHENIAKLLVLKAPRETRRTYDAVRFKLKQLRNCYHLDNEGGKPDSEKVYVSLVSSYYAGVGSSYLPRVYVLIKFSN